MSTRTLSWILFAVLSIASVLLFNYWASFQPLSTLVYTGIVLVLLGFANIAFPFRFLGVRRRSVGVLMLAGGVLLTVAALYWPARTVRVAQHRTLLDDIMPEYQFGERHSIRIHAQPEQVMLGIRHATFGDMKSLIPLLRVRAAALRIHDADPLLQDRQIIDSFLQSGFLSGGSDHEVLVCGAWNARENRRPDLGTLQQLAAYNEPGTLKMAYDFNVEDAGDGWYTVTTETRVLALDDATRRGMARYWRLIVPGSGLLRRQWLDGIKRRAEGSQAS